MNRLWTRCIGLVGVLTFAVVTTSCDLLPFTATVEVQNLTLTPIEVINISPSISPGWGRNHLDENLSPLNAEEFTVPAGKYDLRAIDALGRTATQFDVRLRPDDVFVWELTGIDFE